MELGKTERLDEQGNLPSCLQVYSHYLYLRSENVKSEQWKCNVSQKTKVKAWARDLLVQWDKTHIPFNNNTYQVEKRISRIVQKCQFMSKKPSVRRKQRLGQELGTLFDLSLCQHEGVEICSCNQVNKVPPNWVDFMIDQQGDRQSKVLLSERAKSLRGGVRDLTVEEKEEEDKIKKKLVLISYVKQL